MGKVRHILTGRKSNCPHFLQIINLNTCYRKRVSSKGSCRNVNSVSAWWSWQTQPMQLQPKGTKGRPHKQQHDKTLPAQGPRLFWAFNCITVFISLQHCHGAGSEDVRALCRLDKASEKLIRGPWVEIVLSTPHEAAEASTYSHYMCCSPFVPSKVCYSWSDLPARF